MPDGTQVEMPDKLDPALAVRLKNFQTAQQKPPAPDQPTGGAGGGVADALGTPGQVASEVARPVARGLTALPLMAADAGVQAGNLVNRGLDKLGVKTYPEHELEQPSKVFDRALDSVTQKPKTKTGQAVEDVESALVGGPASAEEKAANALLGKAPTARESLMDSAHRAGFALPPSETGRPIGRTVQSMAGKAPTELEHSFKNQDRTDQLAKVALGMHPDDVLDSAALDRLRRPAYAAYEALASTGTVKADGQYINDVIGAGKRFKEAAADFPGSVHPDIDKLKATYLQDTFTARGAIDAMKQLRADAAKNLKNYDPEKNAIGIVQREISDALLSRLDRQAGASGNKDLARQFKEARTQLAKIQTVEDSMIGSHVSAKELGKLLASGKPLTGELKQIAQFAEEFPKAFQDVGKKGQMGPYSVVDMLIGTGGLASAGTAMATHHATAGLGMAAASIARPLARAALRSKPYQRMSTAPRAAKGATSQAVKGRIPQSIAVGATSPDLGEGP
jgi:hypothetical protein